MNAENEIDHRILEVIIRSANCELEEVVCQCEGLTWNQVFLTIDRLSRKGELQLRLKRPGVYTVCLSHPATTNSVVGTPGA